MANEQLVRELEYRFGDRATDGLWCNVPAETMLRILAALQAQPAEPSAEVQALVAIRAAMRRYLPPDSGITAEQFASEVIGIVDGRK